MSPIRLTIALSISVALIGGAMWFRFGQTTYTSSNIVAVDNLEPSLSNDAFLEDFLATSTLASTKTTSTEPLSQTDIIGRQLFSDYIALKSQGQVTPSNINALADKYAEGIINLNISARQVSLNQIIVVLDSEENLAIYGNAVVNIRNKYKNLVTAQYGVGGVTDINSTAFSTFMSTVGKLYQSAANELLSIKIPLPLAKNHVDLVNNYLVTAEAMESISHFSDDPAQALASLNVRTKNAEEEVELFLNIQQTMMANGIILSSGI